MKIRFKFLLLAIITASITACASNQPVSEPTPQPEPKAEPEPAPAKKVERKYIICKKCHFSFVFLTPNIFKVMIIIIYYILKIY